MTTTKTFKEAYAEITEMSVKQVDLVLEIQDKQDAKYSRVKTCKGLWKIAHAAGAESAREEMQALQKENEGLKKIARDLREYQDNESVDEIPVSIMDILCTNKNVINEALASESEK